MIFPPHDQTPEILKPTEKTLHLEATLITGVNDDHPVSLHAYASFYAVLPFQYHDTVKTHPMDPNHRLYHLSASLALPKQNTHLMSVQLDAPHGRMRSQSRHPQASHASCNRYKFRAFTTLRLTGTNTPFFAGTNFASVLHSLRFSLRCF